MASYCQESTRYCNYGMEKFDGGITVIAPNFWKEDTPEAEKKIKAWTAAQQASEDAYLMLLAMGATPQEARGVLTNSLKTELVMTANPREWRHFFKLRTPKAAHPDIRKVANELLAEFHEKFPVLFDDIPVQEV